MSLEKVDGGGTITVFVDDRWRGRVREHFVEGVHRLEIVLFFLAAIS
jgi:hypothetical protein